MRPISTYLAELLDGLPRQLVQFMLRTAILDRFSAPLCKAVSGADSSQALLQSIEARQLLLVPLDQEGRWYRYHPLMADHLARAAEAQLGDGLPELHRHASGGMPQTGYGPTPSSTPSPQGMLTRQRPGSRIALWRG